MSFDALTISGVVAALVSAGFVVGVVRNNDRRRARDAQDGSTTA
jgi:high-affinity Fe2+/Pb2+ permease